MLQKIESPKKLKRLAVIFTAIFAVSLLFPTIGSVINKQGNVLPIAGSLDVLFALAAFIAFVLLSVEVKKQGRKLVNGDLQRIIPYVSSIPLLLILLYFLQVKVNWEILLIGLGWRYWLLLTSIPYLLSAFHR